MKARMTLGAFTMAALALLLVIASAPYVKDRIAARRCGKRLAAISQAARLWADAHDSRLPNGFVMMSNELATPSILICPGDKSRDPADNWQALTSANSSYHIYEGAISMKDLPLEMAEHLPYLQCKVHGGNYANALGNVSVDVPPLPVWFLAGLAILVFLGSRWWRGYKPFEAQPPPGTAAGALLPSIEQVRQDYLSARGRAPSPWYRRGLVAAARQAVRALGFFHDRQRDGQGLENQHRG